jgi:hypothetical protein
VFSWKSSLDGEANLPLDAEKDPAKIGRYWYRFVSVSRGQERVF